MRRFFADRQSRACDANRQPCFFVSIPILRPKIKHQKGQITFGNACNNLANAKTLFFRLQDCCKRQNVLFLICKIVANAKTFFFRLQDCCKRQKVLFPICKIVASAANYFFRFARVLQAFPKTDKPLQKGMNSGKQRLAEAQQAFIKSGSGRMDLGAFLPPLWEMNSRQRSRDDGFFSFGWCACSYAPMVGAVLPVRRLTP